MRKILAGVTFILLSFNVVAQCSPHTKDKPVDSSAREVPLSKANISWLPEGQCVGAYTSQPGIRWVCSAKEKSSKGARHSNKSIRDMEGKIRGLKQMQKGMMQGLSAELDMQRSEIDKKIVLMKKELEVCKESAVVSRKNNGVEQRVKDKKVAAQQKSSMALLQEKYDKRKRHLENKVRSMESELAVANKNIASYKSATNRLQSSHKEAKNKAAGVGNRLAMANTKIAMLESEVSSLKANAKQAQKQVGKQQKLMAGKLNVELDKQKKNLDIKTLEVKNKLTVANKEIATLKGKINAAQSKHKQVEEKRNKEQKSLVIQLEDEFVQQKKNLELKTKSAVDAVMEREAEVGKLKIALQEIKNKYSVAEKIVNDLDQDGVANAADFCPASDSEGAVESTGCVAEYDIDLVYFDTSSDALTDKAKKKLEHIASVLGQHKNSIFEVRGHTDSKGNIWGNLALSKARAVTVVEYLEANGVLKEQLIIVAEGEKAPIASNAVSEGRAINRRATLKFKK